MISPAAMRMLKTGNILFLLLYLVVSYHNRLAIDDFHTLYNVNHFSVTDATTQEYGDGSSRWMAVFISHLVVSFHQYPVFLFEFHIVLFLLLFFAVRWLVNNLHERYSILFFAASDHAPLFLINAFFWSTTDIGETWFWACSASTYLVNAIAIIAAAAWITGKQKNIFLHLAGLFSFVTIGGTLESSSVFLLFIFSIVLAFHFLFPKMKIASHISLPRFITGLLVLCVAFYFLITGPAMEKRMTFFPESGAGESFFLNVKITGRILIDKFLFVIPFLLLFTFPFMLFSTRKDKTPHPVSLFLAVTIPLFLFFVYLFPITWKTGDDAAGRALTVITLLFIFFAVYFFISAGSLVKINDSVKSKLILIHFSLIALLNGFQLVRQYHIVSHYSAAYDQRWEYLESRKEDRLIELDPLPASGMLYSAEIDTDTAHFSNYLVKEGMGLKGQVRVKK
ncbi:MAG: hypothetical protein ACOZCO_06580 [Bacteroidota bacterium]